MQDAIRVEVQHRARNLVRQAHRDARVRGARCGVAQEARVESGAQGALGGGVGVGVGSGVLLFFYRE